MTKTGKKRRHRLVRKLIRILFLLLLLAFIGWRVLEMLKLKYTVTYTSYTATTGSISNSLSFSGNMQLVKSATYSASSDAVVRKVNVSPGDNVQKGDSLLRLNNGENIEAGFDGRVNKVNVEVGEEVGSGTALVQIADFSRMSVSFRIDEYDISDVRVGTDCTVTVTSVEKTFSTRIATIDYISSGGNVAYYTASAYVDVEEGVYPGMQATVRIPQKEANDVVILRLDALSFDAMNNAFVYSKNADETLEKVYVEVGVSNGNYVEICSGLESGDTVYAEAKTESTSAISGMLTGLFSRNRFTGSNSSRGNTMYGNNARYSGGYGSGFNGGSRTGGGNG